jgi:hypothetical protein
MAGRTCAVLSCSSRSTSADWAVAATSCSMARCLEARASSSCRIALSLEAMAASQLPRASCVRACSESAGSGDGRVRTSWPPTEARGRLPRAARAARGACITSRVNMWSRHPARWSAEPASQGPPSLLLYQLHVLLVEGGPQAQELGVHCKGTQLQCVCACRACLLSRAVLQMEPRCCASWSDVSCSRTCGILQMLQNRCQAWQSLLRLRVWYGVVCVPSCALSRCRVAGQTWRLHRSTPAIAGDRSP